MLWDFAEPNIFAEAAGDYHVTLSTMIEVIEKCAVVNSSGQIEQNSAHHHPFPDNFAQAFFSDPPYYNAVPYADLSDFFYVWLKRLRPRI